jgi:hypothetical protein
MVCVDWEELAMGRRLGMVGRRLGRVERPCRERFKLEGKRGGTVTFTWLDIFRGEAGVVPLMFLSAASLLTAPLPPVEAEVLLVVVLSVAVAAVFSPDAAVTAAGVVLSTAAL